ncbi:MAG TPA: universal stress protein, partial [Bacteroidales bacterium]|nr:universal stress protein [Bacteroidales bacterium]
MNNKKILVPVDFTRLSDKVIEHAATIGIRAGSDLVLLHCADRSADLDTLKIKLAEKAVKASRKFNITCDSKVRTGNIFTAIPEEADDSSYYL